MLFEQGHILAGGSAAAEAGRGLDIVRAGLADHAAQLDLLCVGQQARLDDDFQQLAAAMTLDIPDLAEHLVIQAILHPADVDDHVDLGRAVGHGVGRLEALGGGGVVAVGEADDGADGDPAGHIFRRLLHIAGGDADAGAAIFDAVIADGLDLLPGGALREQRVIHAGEDILQFLVHSKHSFSEFCLSVVLLYHTAGKKARRAYSGVKKGGSQSRLFCSKRREKYNGWVSFRMSLSYRLFLRKSTGLTED